MPSYREINDTAAPDRFFRMHRLMWSVLGSPGPFEPLHDMSKKWRTRGWKEITRNQHLLLFYDGKSALPRAYFARKDTPDPFMWDDPLDGHWVNELKCLVAKKR
jgi:hypothetical protein